MPKSKSSYLDSFVWVLITSDTVVTLVTGIELSSENRVAREPFVIQRE